MDTTHGTPFVDPLLPEEGRMRGARTRRILMLPATRISIAAALFLILQFAVGVGSQAFPAAWQGPMVTQLLSFAVALGVFLVVVRGVERRPLADAGLPRRTALLGTGIGFAVGAALIAGMIGTLALSGWYEVVAVDARAGFLLRGLVLFLLVAAAEELLFRGLLFRILEEGAGSWVALGATAVLFGAVHLANANATLLGALGTGLVGVALGAAYVATRDLWLAVGIHWSWNFVLGVIFGAPVSGRDAGPSLLTPVVEGPALWTGAAFGVEAGLAGFLAAAVASAVLLAVAARRRAIVPLRRTRPETG